ncbi:MAG: DUF4350 domain-containing protein [Peptococcaceae bacterium]|nr:DUF4350 domain-containing protein [Peptococcaceae bacterium]
MFKNRKTTLFFYLGIFLIIILVVLSLFIPNTVHPPFTTFSPKANGTKAIFLLLNKEGFEAFRLFTAVPQGQGLLVMVEPEGSLTERDWEQVLDWVARGNTLLMASGNPNYLYEHLDYDLNKVSGMFKTGHVSSDHPLLKDVRELSPTGGARLKKHASMTFTYGDEQGIYLAQSVKGKGHIVLLTLPDLFTNREIAKKDNLVLFLNIVRQYGQEGVWFNELAHGYTWEKNTRDIFTWPLRLAAVQLALGVLLLYYYWGKRFGRPIPLPENTDQISGEYVSSLANIYRLGRARHLTLESIYQGFKHDLAQYLGVPRHLSSGELVKIFSGRPRIDTKKLTDLLGRCEGLMGKPAFSETDLFTIARDMEIWRENNLVSRPERRKKYGG